MSAMGNKKKTATTLLTCEHCGAEQQIVDDVDNLDRNEMLTTWQSEHDNCGRPAGEVAVEALEDRIFAASPRYHTEGLHEFLDDHPRRPSWGTPSFISHDDGACRQQDLLWRSESIDVPLLRFDGRVIKNGDSVSFYPAKLRVRLMQGPFSIEPFISARKMWWTGKEWSDNVAVTMTLQEAELAVASLQGLIDIARADTGVAVDIPDNEGVV